MPKFLTDPWFDEVEKLRAAAGDIPIPEPVKGIKINMVVTGHPDGGEKHIHVDAGEFKRGHVEGAPTKMTVPYEIAKKTFIDNDQQAGMQAFMSGQIRVEGDMSVIMRMQAAGATPPNPKVKELEGQVRAITEA
jgi:hypothetical protein